jgi:hypothetical protein
MARVNDHTGSGSVTVRDHRSGTVTVREHHHVVVRDHRRDPPRYAPPPPRNSNADNEKEYVSRESEAILADRGSSIEDKLTAILILVSNAFDRLIDKKIKDIQKLQGMLKTQSGEDLAKTSKSIDTETLELQRLTTKREQFFKLLQGAIEKYNGTAQGVLQKLNQ